LNSSSLAAYPASSQQFAGEEAQRAGSMIANILLAIT